MQGKEFLEAYRVMEELLTNKYTKSKKNYSSVVMRFISEPEGQRFRERLNICREIRNILTHSPRIGGQEVLTPSQQMVDTLYEVIEYLRRPPMALDFATPGEKIMTVGLDDRAYPLMNKMEQRGFSHIPVMDQKCFFGIFSISTLFSYILDHPGMPLDPEITIGDFYDYLPIENHVSEAFLFMDKKATYWDVRRQLDTKSRQKKRMAAIFITSSGLSDNHLLGMITPWDVLGEGARIMDSL